MNLDYLFRPQSIAVVGVSKKKVGWGIGTINRLRQYGYSGELVSVGSQATDLPVPNVERLADLSAAVDLCIVAVPAKAAVDVVREAAASQLARSFVVYASGFAESGAAGSTLQMDLQAAAGSVPLLGPNCLGIVNRTDKVYASMGQYLSRPQIPEAAPIAIVSQSGALGYVLATNLERHGLSFNQYCSVGNEALIDSGDVGTYLIRREDIAVVGLYLESVRNAESLARLAITADQLGKRVVVLKTGLSPASQRATLSHTAAVAGDPLVFEAFCQKFGIIRVDSDEAFADLLMVLQRKVRLPRNPRVAVLTMSGGAGALISDRLSVVGARVPEFSADVPDAIEDLDILGLAGRSNPVDLGGQFTSSIDKFPRLLDLVGAAADIDCVVSYFTFGDHLLPEYRQIAATLAASEKPGWMVWAAPPSGQDLQVPPGIVVHTVEALTRVVKSLSSVGDARAFDPVLGKRVTEGQLRGILTESDALRVVERLGVPYVETLICNDPAELAAEMPNLVPADHYVVKIDSKTELHRMRAGLVSLRVVPERLEEAVRGLWEASQGLEHRRILVQPQLECIDEFSFGMYRDQVFGPVLIAGPGGGRVEEQDAKREILLGPASDLRLYYFAQQVAKRICANRVTAETLAPVIQALHHLVLSEGMVSSIDLNPILIDRSGSIRAVDSLIVCRDAET